jgi:hypothetical protein
MRPLFPTRRHKDIFNETPNNITIGGRKDKEDSAVEEEKKDESAVDNGRQKYRK